MSDVEEAWAAEMLYGSAPSAAPPTETLTRKTIEMTVIGPPDEAVELDTSSEEPEAEPPPDVNAGAKKAAVVLGGALVCAVAVIVAALVMFGDTAPTASPPAPAAVASAASVATPAATRADPDQAVPFTASANCPAGSTSAQALTDITGDSAWVCVRGPAEATVDGQVLHVDLGRSYVLAAVSITPGWVAKTPGGKDEWLQHRVVSRVQYIFNDTDRTVLTQDTGNAHGPVTTPLPHKVLASRSPSSFCRPPARRPHPCRPGPNRRCPDSATPCSARMARRCPRIRRRLPSRLDWSTPLIRSTPRSP